MAKRHHLTFDEQLTVYEYLDKHHDVLRAKGLNVPSLA